jgi:hypothetical protein
MRFFRSIFLLLGLTFLSGCAIEQISDYSDRSVAYTWVNLDDAWGNRVTGGSFTNLAVPRDRNIYNGGVEKMGEGYLVYHYGLENGPNKVFRVNAMFCIGLCGNTIHSYDFGVQGGDVAAANIRSRGVYNMGSYAIVSESTGLFGPRRFDVKRANGPSKREILTFLLQDAPAQQIPLLQAELNRL